MAEQLVTIGSYSTPFEANLVRSKLEAFELSPSLLDAETVRMDWLWSNALGGVKVQVPESQVADALRALETETEPDDTLEPGL